MMSFIEIWHRIIETNTFNFVIFLAIILYILKKINLSEKIVTLQNNIKNEIKKSEETKKEAEIGYKKAQENKKNIEKEINEIITNSKKTAENISNNIIKQADREIDLIKSNSQKIIENNIEKAYIQIINKIALESFEIVRNDLQKETIQNKELHQKFINEAIKELEGIEI